MLEGLENALHMLLAFACCFVGDPCWHPENCIQIAANSGVFCRGFLLHVSSARRSQAFKFIMLTVLGNSDVSVIYDVSPLLGSLLIIMFLVSIFFIIMKLCMFHCIFQQSVVKMKQFEREDVGMKTCPVVAQDINKQVPETIDSLWLSMTQ